MSQKLKELYINYLSGYQTTITKTAIKTENYLEPIGSQNLDEIIEEQTCFIQGHLDAEMVNIISAGRDKKQIQFKSFLNFKSWYSENYPKTTKKNTGKKKNKVPEVVEEEDTTVEDFEEAV